MKYNLTELLGPSILTSSSGTWFAASFKQKILKANINATIFVNIVEI